MDKIIYSKRIAYGLRKLGFRMLKTDINPYRPELTCYIFPQSDELEAAMGKILKESKQK